MNEQRCRRCARATCCANPVPFPAPCGGFVPLGVVTVREEAEPVPAGVVMPLEEIYVKRGVPVMDSCHECDNRNWTAETQGSPEGMPAMWAEEPA